MFNQYQNPLIFIYFVKNIDVYKQYVEVLVAAKDQANRLMERIGQKMRWSLDACRTIAPLTLKINRLKKEKDVILIAHTYQTPDIVYGVADAVGDSYTLSKIARDAPQSTILF